ncbi:MAG: outer membrane protein assembly factor BamA [Candidatus Aminicenantes bacterium]
MRKIILAVFLLMIPLFLFSQDMVEKIEIIGNERVTRETILYYLSSREGDYFSEELLKRDFRVLWSTGFFSNIKIEEEQGTKGKIVRIIVEENPVIKNIVYKTGKKLKEDDIVNKLKEKDEYILPYSYYSSFKVQRIKKTIQELLLEKGLQSGEVEVQIEKKGKNELDVIFDIREGPKIKVAEVEFKGRTKLPESILKEAMKQNKPHSLLSWVTGKDVFKRNKLEEDLASIKKKLREYGFMEAVVGEPRIEEVTKRSIFFKKQKMKKIIVPVDVGYPYMVGDIKIEGNEIISSKHLREFIQLEQGEIYNTQDREKSVEKVGELYRDIGYLYAQVMPVENLDPKHKKVNITFQIYEGEVAYLHRLNIRGNTYTKDKVIRREILIREGDRFSLAMFKDSILRMKQLGLVELEKEPEIQPNPEDPSQIDVTLRVKELQRNNIQFTAGYSGYQGTFVALSYSTVNFLGAGEKLELVFQHGKRIKNYMFGFTEPYFLDHPITVGFNVYNRYMVYPYLFDRKGKGIDLVVGARIKGYWRTNLTYTYEYINIEVPEDSGQDGGYMGYDPYYFSMWEGGYAVSSIMPVVYRSTVDSPLTPSRGTLYLASCKFAGSFLGGDISMIKPRFEWSFFHPLVGEHVVGLHLEYQFIKTLRESNIPIWEKFFLGGERSIRGYDIYSIGPRSERGANMGGTKSLVLNAEYIIPVGGPLYAIFFYDVGNAYGPDEKLSFSNLYSSKGLEMRIFVPALRVPFRLIFAYNTPKIYPDDSNFAFRFAIGTTF